MAFIMSPRLLGRPWRILGLSATLLLGVIIWTFWYAMNSDKDDIHPLLTQLIPAGHCACQTSTIFECSSCLKPQSPVVDNAPSSTWEYKYGRDDRIEGLPEAQCDAAFPGLYEDINRGVAYWTTTGNITSPSLDKVTLLPGMTRAMIYNGHLYVLATKSKAEDHRRKTVATLSAIHRALSASQERSIIPNIEFIFSIEDKASDVHARDNPIWVLARKATEESLWLMPNFGFWAWDNIMGAIKNEIGPYDEVVSKALAIEAGLPFSQKEQKLVWRGKLSFAPKLRRALLDSARGQSWSDVKELNWNVRENYLPLEDHCRYQFIAHAEGRSYSASLKYRLACRSVPVLHKLQYIQHHHYLLVSSGPLQNYVEVERDFSDLGSKMENLLDNPAKAEKIAGNVVSTFRERYLTPAAEACYWRALWKGYAQVSERPTTKKGLRYEMFVLLSSEEMMHFAIP